MAEAIRLGMFTPSSNTVLEPATAAQHRFDDFEDPTQDFGELRAPHYHSTTDTASTDNGVFADDSQSLPPSDPPTASGELPIGDPPEITPPPSSQST